jgi:hypothetical protein
VLGTTAVPAAAKPRFDPAKDPKTMAYYLRFVVELEVYDGDSASSVDRSAVSFGSDAVARPGESFVLALAAVCAGDEVRVEAELNGEMDAAGRLTVKAKLRLFEGTTCETRDRDGSSATITTTDLSHATAPVDVYNGYVRNYTESGYDDASMRVRYLSGRQIDLPASDIPMVEVAGRLDVTDHEPFHENERVWVGYWARNAEAGESARVNIETCAGDEVMVTVAMPMEPVSHIRWMFDPEISLRESDACDGRGDLEELEGFFWPLLSDTFVTSTEELWVPTSPDDRATLTTHTRLLPYSRFGVEGGLTDVAGLMRQIGVVL